jgi:hypothetical protein
MLGENSCRTHQDVIDVESICGELVIPMVAIKHQAVRVFDVLVRA